MNWLLEAWNGLVDKLPVFGHEEDVTSYLLPMASMSLIIGIAVAIVILALLAFLNRFRNGRWNVSGKLLTTLFCVTWLLGFIIYEIGIYTGEPVALLLNAPMAVIHALEMFILDSDAAALHDEFHHNMVFMACFSMVHFMAAAVSLIFVLKHFGFNIVAGYKMLIEAYMWNTTRQDTFIFWGMNEPSFLLAKSIQQSRSDKKDYRIIIVRTDDDRDRTSMRNGIERLFNFLSLKNKDLEKLQDLRCLTASTFIELSKLDSSIQLGQGHPDVIKKRLSLRQLSIIVKRKTRGTVHLFFLGDDQSANIQSITNLKNDATLVAFATGGRPQEKRHVRFYCHARRNSVHRVVEDEQMLHNIDVKVVDSSLISIDQLKQDVNLHPVNYVDVEHDATVSSAFNALVVGFGEIGIDAVRFLYEFGAFVKTGTAASKVQRSTFHCDVVDSRMSVIAGPFLANAPAIKTELITRDGSQVPMHDSASPNGKCLLSLHQLDVMGVDFYKKLENWVKDLNYIVIATDDDEHNMSLAVRIFRLATMYRANMEHFRIMVRVKSDADGHIRNTAWHYNRLWAAEQAAGPSPMHQRSVTFQDRFDAPITVFGLNEMVYTYDYIVSEKIVAEAKAFKARYDASIAALKDKSGLPSQYPTASWDDEYMDLMQLEGDYQGYSPTYTGMMRLRRIQSQNQQNCYHLYTKQKLAREALADPLKFEALTSGNLFRRNNEIEYVWKNGATPMPDVIAMLDVLARTEHLRWCASHEILGYRDHGDEDFKDETHLQHGCLKPWEQLSTEKKSYDYNIVDVSLGIINT